MGPLRCPESEYAADGSNEGRKIEECNYALC